MASTQPSSGPKLLPPRVLITLKAVYLGKPSSKTIWSNSDNAVWVKVAQVYFSEMRSGVKMGSSPGFLCHTN